MDNINILAVEVVYNFDTCKAKKYRIFVLCKRERG